MEKLRSEDVRKTVDLFWTTFLAKSEDVLNSYYASDSSVFQIAMGRSEPGRLGAMRRSREYFRSDTRMDLKLGPIDVALIGTDAAVATSARCVNERVQRPTRKSRRGPLGATQTSV